MSGKLKSQQQRMEYGRQDLPDKCLETVADETLEHGDVIDNFLKIHKDVIERLPITIISDSRKEEIRAATTSPQASGLMRQGLKNSADPEKLHCFVKAIRGPHPREAQNIQTIHEEALVNHKCPVCVKT